MAERAAAAVRRDGQDVLVCPPRPCCRACPRSRCTTRRAARARTSSPWPRRAAGTRVAALVVAETEALTWAGRCEPGDVLGIADGEVVLIAPDLACRCACGWLDRMLLGGGEIVTALLGAGTDAGARRGARGRPAAQPPGGRRRRPPRRPHRLPAGVGGGMTELSTRHWSRRWARVPPSCWPPSCPCTRSATCSATTRAATSTAGGSPTSRAWRSASTSRSSRRWRRPRCATCARATASCSPS